MILAWHFSNGKEAYGKHRKTVAGKTHTVTGRVALCERGLHGSVRAIHALNYAPYNTVQVERVRLSGTIVADTDKHVATERTYLAVANCERLFHEFACWCAERVLKAERKAGREPDPRSWAAIWVKRQWLQGKATDEELAAARAAAGDAAGAAWDAARDAQNKKLEAMLNKLLETE